MTFEDAVDIIYHPELVFEERMIQVQFADGRRLTVKARVNHNMALFFYRKEWHVIHVPSELAIYSVPDYNDAQELVNVIVMSKIDTNWGYRDLHVFKSILQLIGLRKQHKARRLSLVTENCSGSQSA